MTVQTFTHARFASPLGDLHLVLDGAALVALDYPGYEPRMLRLLGRRFAGARLAEGAAPAAVADALARYFAGDGGALGGLDLSPMVALVVLQLAQMLLVAPIRDFAVTLF